jgi:malate dehydrogenase (oxaloacetate-decarboxylating)
VFLANMRDRNEVLFYRLLAEHLGRDAADVYTPDGWEAIERYTMNTPPAWRVPVGKSS